MTTTATKTSNRLHYTATKTIKNGKHTLTAKVLLGDDCQNGHIDFSVTGEIYEAGKSRSDRYLVSCGAIGDTVAKHFPDLAPFCRLHLCDFDGVPMHGVANMFYHMRHRFNAGHEVTSHEHRATFCDYYRITTEEFDALQLAETETRLAMILVDLPILERWKAEAADAIAKLEALTGLTFENDSTKSNLRLPSAEAMQTERERLATGCYTTEAIEARRIAGRAAKRAKIITDAESKVKDLTKEIEAELAVTLAIFDCGIDLAVDQHIYYNHTNTVKLNWRGYGEKLTEKQIEQIKATVTLPDGVTWG